MIRFSKLKISMLSLSCLLFLAPVTASYAAKGCCAHHKGATSSCDSATNRIICGDTTVSPTCACSGGVTSAKKQPKEVKVTKAKEVKKPTVKEKKAALIPPNKRCCLKHGGVGKCNTSTKLYACQDGSASSCKCMN